MKHLLRRRSLFITLALGLLTVTLFTMGASSVHAAPGEVLILSTTVTGGLSSHEAQRVVALGKTPIIKTPAEWALLTAADFASYDGIILGDPTCSTNVGLIAAAEANALVWGPQVDGNVIIIGSDPVYHWNVEIGAQKLVNQGIEFALGEAGKTGAYIDLSCYYHFAAANTPVPVLDGLNGGGFTVVGGSSISLNNVHIVASHPALVGLTDADLSGWNNSVHEAFVQTWPAQFEVLAVSVYPGGPYTATDGTIGYPYIMARGEDLTVISNIQLAPDHDVNPVGTTHTVTATVTENGAPPASPRTVTFMVVAGPHAGTMGTDVTDASGQATFTYTGAAVGQDVIRATYDFVTVDPPATVTYTSNAVTKDWEEATPPPTAIGIPFAGQALMALVAVLLGTGIVWQLKRRAVRT